MDLDIRTIGDKATSPSDLLNTSVSAREELQLDRSERIECGFKTDFLTILKDRIKCNQKNQQYNWPKDTDSRLRRQLKNFMNRNTLTIENEKVCINKTQYYEIDEQNNNLTRISKKEFDKKKADPNFKLKLAQETKNLELLEDSQAVQVFQHVHNDSVGHNGM